MRSKADETLVIVETLICPLHTDVLFYCLVINVFSSLLLRHYCIYLRCMQLVSQKFTATSTTKRSRSDVTQFQES